MTKKIILQGLIHALGEGVYVFLVAFLMNNAEKIFGKTNDMIGPVAFILLFVVSAAVSGALVLGKPILLYLENKKVEAIKLFLATLGWLVVILLVLFVVLIVK